MENWEYKNLQFQTSPTFGAWSKISESDLGHLEKFQDEGWEVFQVVNIKGSFGFSSHILFMLRQKRG